MPVNYQSAGVNIDAGNETVRKIKDKVKSTFSPYVLTGIGGFGSLFDIKEALKNYQHPVLVQSIDGVGTKLVIAEMMNKFDTVGMDIVNHCCNDILAMGAKPLTFLDYVANEKLDPAVMENIISGMARACIENNLSLVGGETAEMPGVYLPSEHDIAGCITGVVEKEKIITGKNIVPGDIVFGFASNGLQTNGFSLARKLFFEIGKYNVDSKIPELEKTVGETLLAPHQSFVKPVFAMLNDNINIKGIAHITGGGFIDNIPRILPGNCAVEIKKRTWPVLPIFEVMRKLGELEETEMYRTFNMGIGLILIVRPDEAEKVKNIASQYSEFKIYQIGKITGGEKQIKLL